MKKNSAGAFTLLALAALLAVGAVTFAHDPNSAAVHDSPSDLSYIDMMMMHHSQGIEMARLAQEKGQLPQLKEFAGRVIADQEKGITELQGLRDRFYANQPPADKMKMGGMIMTQAEMQRMSEADMQKLRGAAAGKEFDHLFLALLTKHHQMAISMSRSALGKAEHAEVKEFARMVISKQGQEITEMNRMDRQVHGARGRRG